MTVEREVKFFGINSSRRELMPGEIRELNRGRGFFNGKIDKFEFEVVNQDMIRLRTSTSVYGSFALTYHVNLNPTDYLLFREEINTENIQGTTFLGAKERIIWKPSK